MSADISDIGPGLWWITHSLAAKAQTPADLKRFEEHIAYMRSDFPCDKCKPHIIKFFNTHRIKDYLGDTINGKEVGPFRLTHIMHSQVNERLGKPFFSFEKAYDLYFNTEACMDVCPGVIEDVETPSATDSLSRYRSVGNKQRQKPKFTLMRIG